MSSITKRIKNFIGFNIPSYEISEKRENEILKKISGFFIKYKLESPAAIVTQTVTPFNRVLNSTIIYPMAPIIEFLGISVYDYIAFFEKKENLNKLLELLEQSEDKNINLSE